MNPLRYWGSSLDETCTSDSDLLSQVCAILDCGDLEVYSLAYDKRYGAPKDERGRKNKQQIIEREANSFLFSKDEKEMILSPWVRDFLRKEIASLALEKTTKPENDRIILRSVATAVLFALLCFFIFSLFPDINTDTKEQTRSLFSTDEDF